jgi:PadR family transcriptional regulator, regulatory protein PadR
MTRASRAPSPPSLQNGAESHYTVAHKCVDLSGMRKRSIQTRQIFQALLDAPEDETYGFELVKVTGLPSGSVYPILRRLEDEKIITAREEVIDPNAKRPRYRIYYRLTAEGRRIAREATREKSKALRSLNPGWHT